MSLQLTVDALDNIPEPVRDFYEEADGKFRLKVEGIEDTTALKKALDSERKNASESAKLAKAYKDLGMSADDIKALVSEKKAAEQEKAKKEGDFHSLLKQHQDDWAREKAELAAQIEAATTSERKAVIGTSLMAALTKAGATEEGIDLLPDRLATRIRYDFEDGGRVIRILSANGETPLAGAGKDGTATFDDLAKEATSKWPSLFKGSGAGGGGKPPGSAGGAGGKTITRTAFNALAPHDQAATVRGGTRVVD